MFLRVAPLDRRIPARLQTAYRAVAFLGSLCLGLGILVVYLLWTRSSPDALDAALQSDEVREQAVRHLVEMGGGIWDSFPDPDVGRILQPNLAGRQHDGFEVTTNELGVRERAYALPKPQGLIRVVLLGDSYLFGPHIRMEERAGRFLEQSLRKRSTTDRPIEVVQIGMSSWNVIAEAAYLRRQLSLLQPDLVIHVTVPNDLDDTMSIRGFGTPSRFSARHRGRADSLLISDRRPLGFSHHRSPLPLALDWESRTRFADARDAIDRLAMAVRERGGHYLLVLNWAHLLPVAQEHLAAGMNPDELAYIAWAFWRDKSLWVAPRNPHWNAEGNQRVARMLHGLIEQRQLLPALALEPWEEARETVARIHEVGREEAHTPYPPERRLRGGARSAIDFKELDEDEAALVHGGVTPDGLLSPYASLLLQAGEGARRVVLHGRALDRPELGGANVRVFLDEEAVGEITLESGREVAWSAPIPTALHGRPFLTVRLEADDYVYVGPDLQRCVTFRLDRVSIE